MGWIRRGIRRKVNAVEPTRTGAGNALIPDCPVHSELLTGNRISSHLDCRNKQVWCGGDYMNRMTLIIIQIRVVTRKLIDLEQVVGCDKHPPIAAGNVLRNADTEAVDCISGILCQASAMLNIQST